MEVIGDPEEPREYKEFPCLCKVGSALEISTFPWNVMSLVQGVFNYGPKGPDQIDTYGRTKTPMFTDSIVVGRGEAVLSTFIKNQYGNTYIQTNDRTSLSLYYLTFPLNTEIRINDFIDRWAKISTKSEGFAVMKISDLSYDETSLLSMLEGIYTSDGFSVNNPGINYISNTAVDPDNPGEDDIVLGFFNV